MALQRMVIALLLSASCSWLILASASTTYKGYGTVYSLSSPFDGNCNFMSWPEAAVTKYAALNAEQWEETMNCGRCAEVSCTDASCSGQPEIVYIMDQCPGCGYGDLDLSPDAFESITGQSYTKLSIEWKFVDCPISNNVQYCLKTGSNEFWVAVQPTNFVSGVASLSINGQKTTMVNSAYYFLVDGCGTSVADLNSVSISMKGLNGEVFEETLSLTADKCTTGNRQFVSSGDTSQTTITNSLTSSISTGLTRTSSISQTATFVHSKTPTLTLASMPTATVASAQEKASSSNRLYSTAAIVAAVSVALAIVGSVTMIVRKKCKRLEESKIVDDRTSPESYVSIRSPKAEVTVVYSAV